MFATKSHELYQKAWSWKDHGRSFKLCFDPSIAWEPGFRYLCPGLGTNLRMTEMQAALGRYYLAQLEEMVHRRRENAKILIDSLTRIVPDLIEFPPFDDAGNYSAYYKVYGYLKLGNIDTLSHGEAAEISSLVGQLAKVPCGVGVTCELFNELCVKNQAESFRNPTGCPMATKLGRRQIMFVCHPTIEEDVMVVVADRIAHALATTRLK